MYRILITGFDAFGEETVNPAQKILQLVSPPENTELIRLEVPTAFGLSAEVVEKAMEDCHPHAVLCIGQAGGRSAVTPERVAINIMDASIPDNQGQMPQDLPVIPGGENALFATVPVKKMVAAIREAGIPSQLSYSAGTFVCNQLFYRVLSLCREKYPATAAGFIHVPFLTEQTVTRPQYPSLSLPQMVTAIEAALSVLAE